MEKKVIKFISEISKKEITLTVDERLNKIDERKVAPEKLAKANEALKGVKLPR
ncbi:hypothetical protein [Chitinophaga filiformis]|uniref:Addiction module component n=1 Tax=Chitinophaga filiformis TaxID=104663 RepID=A0ABY4HWW9_CHIFI|nr:hypothetical protein [Chitinophaga filiformis]UPK68298.1 hypothetical protein MYF79_25405 [Chitinophaga filiformis]